jgi:hypothetical protein
VVLKNQVPAAAPSAHWQRSRMKKLSEEKGGF